MGMIVLAFLGAHPLNERGARFVPLATPSLGGRSNAAPERQTAFAEPVSAEAAQGSARANAELAL